MRCGQRRHDGYHPALRKLRPLTMTMQHGLHVARALVRALVLVLALALALALVHAHAHDLLRVAGHAQKQMSLAGVTLWQQPSALVAPVAALGSQEMPVSRGWDDAKLVLHSAHLPHPVEAGWQHQRCAAASPGGWWSDSVEMPRCCRWVMLWLWLRHLTGRGTWGYSTRATRVAAMDQRFPPHEGWMGDAPHG